MRENYGVDDDGNVIGDMNEYSKDHRIKIEVNDDDDDDDDEKGYDKSPRHW